MGFRGGFVAVHGVSADDVLRRLNATVAGAAPEPEWAYQSSCPSVGPTENGWRVLFDFVYENLGFARTDYYQDGGCLWSVSANTEHERRPLTVKGEIPATYQALVAHLDPLEVPVGLGEQICGLRYDSVLSEDDGAELLPIELPAASEAVQ